MLIVMDKSTHEEHLSEPLQTNNKQFKIAVTFLSGFNGNFNDTDKNNKFYLAKSITEKDDFIQNVIPKGAYDIESLKIDMKRITIEDGHFTEANYQFRMKPIFSRLLSHIEISRQKTLFKFLPDDNIKDRLIFNASKVYIEVNLSPNPVDNLSFDNFLLEFDITQRMIFKGRRSGISHNFTMDADPGYKHMENYRRGVQSYKIESKGFLSNISFKLKKEKGNLISFNGQSITFKSSMKQY